jgi:PAS domain S-box-containing protein
MTWQVTYITWVHLVTAIVSLQLIFTVYRMSQIKGRIPFLWMMALASFWSLVLSFESAAPTIADKVMFSRFEYFANMLIPVFFFQFIVSYDLEKPKWFRRYFWLIWIVPLLTIILVFTSNYNTLIWSSFTWSPGGKNILIYHHGPLFYAAMAYSFLLIFLGFALMVSFIRRRPRYYKSKALYLVAASFFPLLTGIIYTVGLSPIEGLDISPMGILISGLIFFWGIARKQLFDLVPAGHQLMIEKMDDGVIVLDRDNFIMDLNPAAIASLDVHESVKGRKLDLVIPALSGLSGEEAPGKELRREIFLPHPVSRWFEVMQNPLKDAREKQLGTLMILHDVTHRRRAEEQLKKLADDLTEMNAMKDRLYSIIGHDLRSPFNSILGFADLLATSYDDFSDDDRRMFANNILTASRNTFNLLENLLEWSRIQMGRTPFSPEEINLSLAVREAIHLLRGGAAEKNIRLIDDIQPQQLVYADRNMLNTILRNLLSNGIKFTANGGAVKVSSQITRGSSEIRVTDTGVGISESILKKLFRIDSLVSTAGTANEKGTGLGLILCKEFVEKHGGAIRVESKVGEGSTFFLNLPGIPAV